MVVKIVIAIDSFNENNAFFIFNGISIVTYRSYRVIKFLFHLILDE